MPVYMLSDDLVFPPPNLATKEGLLAVGGDLRPERILLAYREGIFPWYSDDQPILWWSPDPRLVLYLDEFKYSKSLRKIIKRQLFQVTYNKNFDMVIHECGRTRIDNSEGTWITPQMEQAYSELHSLGHAHSVEAWCDGKLAGGLYGLSIGSVFFGESMFSAVPNASKVCLAALVHKVRQMDYQFIDCQVPTDHLKRLGAREIPREAYIRELKCATHKSVNNVQW